MQFTDISIHRFGSLDSLSLSRLPGGLTVIYGGNGSGKTTLVHFLRAVLFGFDAQSVSSGFSDSASGGEIATTRRESVSEGIPRHQHLNRSASVISATGVLKDGSTGAPLTTASLSLPGWVSEQVYQDIFTVGYQEADRFDNLFGLCLEGSTRPVGSDGEIRRTERAIDQCLTERNGNGIDSGLGGRLQLLRSQRTALQRELDETRMQDPRTAARISQLESFLAEIHEQIDRQNSRVSGLEAEIAQLKRAIEEAKVLNQLPLNRKLIEGKIQDLQDQQARWSSIIRSIQAE